MARHFHGTAVRSRILVGLSGIIILKAAAEFVRTPAPLRRYCDCHGMDDPRIFLRLIGDCRTFRPGDCLCGEFFVDAGDPGDVKVAELSVLWYTEGKGDEDMAVHYFQRISNDNGQFVDLRRTQQFKTELPNSPLSYDGMILKIHWCVRLRIFLPRGKEVVAEQSFQLGAIPRLRAVHKVPAPHTQPADTSIKEAT